MAAPARKPLTVAGLAGRPVEIGSAGSVMIQPLIVMRRRHQLCGAIVARGATKRRLDFRVTHQAIGHRGKQARLHLHVLLNALMTGLARGFSLSQDGALRLTRLSQVRFLVNRGSDDSRDIPELRMLRVTELRDR